MKVHSAPYLKIDNNDNGMKVFHYSQKHSRWGMGLFLYSQKDSRENRFIS